MYARTVGKRNLNFAVSGALWNRSLVMMDSETKSLWSHLLGEAMDGELKGTVLESYPSHMTDWANWRAENPETTVAKLSRTSQRYRTEFYRNPSQFVVGIAGGGMAKAWNFQQLTKTPIVNDQFSDQSLVVVFDSKSKTALTFSRTLDDQVLTFEEKDKAMVDRETRSVWNRLSGKAIDGPLKGKRLAPMVSIVSFSKAWVTFHPNTTGLTKAELEESRAPRRSRNRQPRGDDKKP